MGIPIIFAKKSTMKHVIYILCFVLVLVSCKQEEPSIDGFLIEGKIDKPQNSAIVKLFRLENKKIIPIDSAVALTDSFTLNGKIDHPDMYYITIEGVNGSIPILLENAKIDVDVYTDSLYASKMKGGKETEYYMMYQDYIAGLRGRNAALTTQFREASQTNDTATISRLRQEQQALYTANDAFEVL